MINCIRIRNFKSILDTEELQIAPLTFFIGPNSSGKSSILKAFLVAHQTAITVAPDVGLQVEGKAVSLGAFPDFVYMHDSKNQVQFDFTFDTKTTSRWASKGRPSNAVRFTDPASLSAKFARGAQTRVIALETFIIYFKQSFQ